MPLWAKYDRANGRIVAITEADQAPPEDKLIAVIEAGSGAKVGDFIGDAEGAQEPEQDLTPDAPQVGKPPPSPPGHEGQPPPGHAQGGKPGTPPGQVGKPPPPGQASKPQPKDE